MDDADCEASYSRLLVPTLAVVASFGYGAFYYAFSVLITREAAGGVFSTGLLSAAFGGAVLTGGIVAIPVGRIADHHGIRGVLAAGGAFGFVGMFAFAAAEQPWHVLLAWLLLIGPATAMTFYEPIYVGIQQWFAGHRRIHAIAMLTLLGGLSGPISLPVTTALVEAFGWRKTSVALGASVLVVTVAAAVFVVPGRPRRAPGHAAQADARGSLPLWSARFLLFSVAAMLAYGSMDAIIVHRVARFEEAGFLVATVAAWAAVAGLLSIPGRYLLPTLARRIPASTVFAGVLAVMGLSTALAVDVSAAWQMVGHFLIFGLVFGAALPLRAVVMGEWFSSARFGLIMGVQAAGIALARAAYPAGVGLLRDDLGSYPMGIALLAASLMVAAVLVIVSSKTPAASNSDGMPLPPNDQRPANRTSAA